VTSNHDFKVINRNIIHRQTKIELGLHIVDLFALLVFGIVCAGGGNWPGMHWT